MKDERPTIVQVLHCLRTGGAEVLSLALAESLSDQFRYVYVCLDEEGELADAARAQGIRVHCMHRKPGIDLGCVGRLREVLYREKPALIHAHQYGAFFYSSLARLGTSRLPIIYTEHGRPPNDAPSFRHAVANFFLCRYHDQVITVSEDMRKAVIANESIPKRQVKVIYNGVNSARIQAFAGARKPVRLRFGVSDDQVLVVQVARLEAVKDHVTALRAMARLKRSHPGVRLLLAGTGSQAAAIARQISELGIENSVIQAGYYEGDVAEVMQAADIFLLSSIKEGAPLTILEALSAGKPVLATDVGGVSELVASNQTGLLCAAGDPEAMARQLSRLAESENLRDRLGTTGRARVEQEFSEQQMHHAYRKTFHGALGAVGTRNRRGAGAPGIERARSIS